PDLDAAAEPGNRPILGEHAEFERPGDVAEALQRGRVQLLDARPFEHADRADLEPIVADEADPGAVAGTAEGLGRTESADGEYRVGPPAVPLRSLENRLVAGLGTEGDGPIRRGRRW